MPRDKDKDKETDPRSPPSRMADLAWLRTLGQRSRPPSNPRSKSRMGDDGANSGEQPGQQELSRPPSAQQQQHHHHHHLHRRPHLLRRASSYFSIHSGGSGGSGRSNSRAGPALPPPPSLTMAPRAGAAGEGTTYGEDEDRVMYVREEDSVWHNPSLMQLVEKLQVVMMTKGDSMTPVPVQYNGYIMHLLEGFGKLQHEIEDSKVRTKELEDAQQKELDEFRAMSEEWISREEMYKAEIKRLEVLLAKNSRDGMETVVLARSNSLVNRNDTRKFVTQLKRISRGSTQGETPPFNVSDGSPEQPAADGTISPTGSIHRRSITDNDALLSDKIRTEQPASSVSRSRRRAHKKTSPWQGLGAQARAGKASQRLSGDVTPKSKPGRGTLQEQTRGSGIDYMDSESSSSDEGVHATAASHAAGRNPKRVAPFGSDTKAVNLGDGRRKVSGQHRSVTTDSGNQNPFQGDAELSGSSRYGRHRHHQREFSFEAGDDNLSPVEAYRPQPSQISSTVEPGSNTRNKDPAVRPGGEQTLLSYGPVARNEGRLGQASTSAASTMASQQRHTGGTTLSALGTDIPRSGTAGSLDSTTSVDTAILVKEPVDERGSYAPKPSPSPSSANLQRPGAGYSGRRGSRRVEEMEPPRLLLPPVTPAEPDSSARIAAAVALGHSRDKRQSREETTK